LEGLSLGSMVVKQTLIASVLTFLSISGSAVVVTVVPSQAESAPRFFCGKSAGVPATMVVPNNKRKPPVPIIRWTSAYFNGAGFSPAVRCGMVSQKFQQAYDNNSNFVFTTSISNGEPIVCAAERSGGACSMMLYTVKRGVQDPITTMLRLEKVRAGASGAINESSSGGAADEPTYVGVQDLIAKVSEDAPEVAETSAAAPQPTFSPTIPTALPSGANSSPLSLW
jgi:Circadian oscillating protein COP23